MITAKIVKYYNDYNQKAFDKTFENLDELADWIFDQMQLDYTKKPGCDFLTFPTDRFGKWYYFFEWEIYSRERFLCRKGAGVVPEMRGAKETSKIQFCGGVGSGYYRKIQAVYAR